MRFQSLVGLGAGVLALCQTAMGSPLADPAQPDIVAVAAFPEENAFHHVVNGEKNIIFVSIENKSDRNVTLQSIAGSFHHPDTNKLVKNTTTTTFSIPLLEGEKSQLPYSFHSEFRPGDLRLNVWVDHVADGEKFRVQAYDSIITIVEPEGSWLDWKLWTTYAIVLAGLGSLGYYTYLTFVPQPKKRKTAPAAVSAPVGTVTATGAGGYQEEWIPEHHLKKPKARKNKSGVATSGDETSGPEAGGAESKKRKGKK
ncbi:hypothetical protein BDY19DRAFT_935298 [Irpex rosettiformis]|uniref:Uncharacterized protein n=1 Tax=Irpex rosettiformis TaxID=378272 RepID=A0ACB8UAJ1_9APHY|nr:hypothetical protein BDY19DRAFT_935298 [Irpex rosettiformis]